MQAMSRVVYVNGRYLPSAQAHVHVEDRGFQFADAIYEVCEVNAGRIVDESRHMARLERSLAELEIMMPLSRRALAHVLREIIRRNGVRNGLVYLQVTRGAAKRDFDFPPVHVQPTLVCLARRLNPAKIAARAAAGIAVKTMPDIRWGRSDIKTVMLLPACLAKHAAHAEGADEAWFFDAKGFVTEGASSNAWIVDSGGTLLTRPLGREILPGVTRATLMALLARDGVAFTERPFHLDDIPAAKEAFVTSASATVMPVVKIDGRLVGDGKPGQLACRLRSTFHQIAELSQP
jgi:D-alanine transaminase